MSKTGIYLGTQGRAYGPYSETEIEALQAGGEFAQFHWIWDDGSRAWQALDPAPAPLLMKAGITKTLPSHAMHAQNMHVSPAHSVPQAVPVHAPAPVFSTPNFSSPAFSPPASSPASLPSQPEPMPQNVIPMRAPKARAKPAQEVQEVQETYTPPAPPRRSFKEKTFQAVCHTNETVVGGTLTQISDAEGVLQSEDESASPSLAIGVGFTMNVLDEKSGKSHSIQASASRVQKLPHGWQYDLRWSQELKTG